MHKLIALALVAAVACNDLTQGPEGGRKVFDEERGASPAIWKQKDEITVNANDTEVISRVVITDRRPNKDGEAKITEGGPGQNNVTIELKSPTVFRGYDFHVEVYVVDKNQQIAPEEPLYPEEVPVNTEIQSMENDTKVNSNTNAEGTQKDSNEHEILRSKVTDKPDLETSDPVVQYVKENKTEEELAKKSMPLKSYSHMGELSYDERFKILHPKLFSTDDDESNDGSDEDVDSTEKAVSAGGLTTARVSTTVGSEIEREKIHGEDNKTLGDVSKLIGERVVFGFKRV